jgi:hypothetical protein
MSFKPEYYQTGYKLTQTQKLILAVSGNVKIFSVDLVGKGRLVDFFAFKCKEHGIVVSMASGHGEILHCPHCPLNNGTFLKPFDFQKIKVS